MGKFLYTVVCRYYTINGIVELDLYEVLRRLRIKPQWYMSYGDVWDIYGVIRYHVYTGQAVEYVIKKVLRDIAITNETKRFYSEFSPYSLMYDCYYDLKDVAWMNNESIQMRLKMSDEDFYKIYGGKINEKKKRS